MFVYNKHLLFNTHGMDIKVNTELKFRIRVQNRTPQRAKILIKFPDFSEPLDAELNPVCHLLALLGGYHILHVFRIRVKLRFFRKSQKI